MNGYELGEIIIHAHRGRHGRLIAFCDTRAPMVEVRWKDLSVTRVPIDMIRKRDNLPVPPQDPTPTRYRRKKVFTPKPPTVKKEKRLDRPAWWYAAEADRLAMKKLYQEKSGDYSY